MGWVSIFSLPSTMKYWWRAIQFYNVRTQRVSREGERSRFSTSDGGHGQLAGHSTPLLVFTWRGPVLHGLYGLPVRRLVQKDSTSLLAWRIRRWGVWLSLIKFISLITSSGSWWSLSVTTLGSLFNQNPPNVCWYFLTFLWYIYFCCLFYYLIFSKIFRYCLFNNWF